MNQYIVIGAGILGASTAYYLAKNGAKVTVIDRKDIGQATDAAAGMICPWVSQRRNKAWYNLAKGGAKLYPKLVKELEKDGETETGYSQVGAISIHTDEKKLFGMKERALKRRETAPEIGEITILDETKTKELFPLLAEGFQSVHIAGGARVDGRAMRDSLIRGAKRYGATVIFGDAKLIANGEKVVGASVGNDMFEADKVIATSGAWMNELLEPLGVQFDVVPQKGQILHVKMPNMDTSNWPVVMPPTNKYILSFDDHIVLGSTHENKSGFNSEKTAGGLYDILSNVLEIAPTLSNSTILESRVGFRPFTPGFLPVIGNLPGFEGLLLANGLGSSGLTTGPFVGKQLANLALGNEIEIAITDYPVSGALIN
ncbi:FAD-binding oxidoreductase [Bacilli bacterium]|uniref:NAD(P)/FAD-dependent oxidoreductase n=1 Tax=Oceanobacillus caeni TaxID=405946 RepID=UPI00062148E1|nr:FAD-binding oxidoreductase [Oceanobacillus caeni]KKE80140.1 oxidoreductase [Bacilli bacterium VT-13-104]PZD83490.1 FAD-binding oxidoreductase [Bacilli bacterium]MBU8790732.1 FAD-binding oxidoreductase [Oceanobacillus caeni]PZD84672.1 FAD-binding oxidoreductase [Bacilli bacterium]PZD86966.1 FAD-binding oxidoreductase [Bacilli bacterium]